MEYEEIMDKTSTYRSLLSNPQILSAYLSGHFPNIKEINRFTYNELHMQNHSLPDYTLKKGRDKAFGTNEDFSSYLTNSFIELSNAFIYQKNKKLYIQSEKFHDWQNILTAVTPLPLISNHLYKRFYKETLTTDIEKMSQIVNDLIGNTSYVSISSVYVDQIVADDGLNERHMHINGSVETDSVWLKALKEPRLFYNEISCGYKNNEIIKEQYMQLGNDATPLMIYNLVRCCRELRSIMVDILFDNFNKSYSNTNLDNINHITLDKLIASVRSCHTIYDPLLDYVCSEHPLLKYWPELSNENERVLEALFYIKAFNHLENIQLPIFARIFHIYILTLNQVNTLLIQQRDCTGFDQFQKVTMNEGRELSEKRYGERFKQFEGMYTEDISSLEARFSPKDTFEGNKKRLDPIIVDFEDYKNKKENNDYSRLFEEESTESRKCDQKRMDLTLVGHFIKGVDKTGKKCSILPLGRHRKLRLKNRRTVYTLLTLAKNCEKINSRLKGFDAASNELHTPPEVFAPIYRLLRHKGYDNFTYHVGEDFVHLCSGIRAVYEAIEFLELQHGNRIGHGTALGIDPQLWKERSLQPAVIEKGEWLDNLVFTWFMLSEEKTEYDYLIPKIEAKIHKLYLEIYQELEAAPIYTIIDAWKIRSVDILLAFENRDYLQPFFEKEQNQINKYKSEQPKAWKIFEYYHQHDVVKRYREDIYLDWDPFSDDVGLLELLQKMILQKMNDKGIAIETLPTSNVRISYYNKHEEHHLPKWLGYKDKEKGFPLPSVVVGSDDTGIFATNLRNEFAHIFLILTKECGLSNDQAYEEIKKLNHNGKLFGFK